MAFVGDASVLGASELVGAGDIEMQSTVKEADSHLQLEATDSQLEGDNPMPAVQHPSELISDLNAPDIEITFVQEERR